MGDSSLLTTPTIPHTLLEDPPTVGFLPTDSRYREIRQEAHHSNEP